MKKKAHSITIILWMICLFVWIPFLLMAGAALMPEDELYWGLERSGCGQRFFPLTLPAMRLLNFYFVLPDFL